MVNDFGIILSKLEIFGDDYSNEIKCLLENLQKTNDLKVHCNYIKAFAKKYTLLPKLWKYWNDTEKRLSRTTPIKNESNQYKHFSSAPYTFSISDESIEKHFYCNFALNDYDSYRFQYEVPIQNFQRIKAMKEGLFFPHYNIEKLYEKYDRNSSYALSQKELNQYKIALTLYKKMAERIDNSEEWLKCLKEVDDSEYIVNSCEFRLSKDPYDGEFWDAYLYFLKSFDTNMLLKTYSRYCRLFLFNYFIRDEYFDAIGNAEIPEKLVYWIDYISLIRMSDGIYATIEKMTHILIQFYRMPENWNFTTDNYDSNLSIFIEIIKNDEENILFSMETKKALSTNSLKNGPIKTAAKIPKSLSPAAYQRFPFKATIMRYILDQSSPQLLQKFQMSCKELYLQKSIVYCQRLCIKSELPELGFKNKKLINPIFFENALIISHHQLPNLNLSNYHLVNSLEIHDILGIMNLIPKIQKCSLRYLNFYNQIITENDLEFFTSNLEFLEFCKVTVTNADGTVASVENIIEKLSHVPNIKLLDLPKICFNSGSAQNLAVLQRNEKLKSFFLNNLPADFKVDPFCKFIEANVAKNAELKFSFDVVDRILKFELGQKLRTKLRKISKNFKLL